MRLATYVHNGVTTAGVVRDDGYYSFEELLGRPYTLLAFIQAYEGKPLPDFAALIAQKTPVPLGEGRLCAPIPQPFRNVICLGRNYADHAKEVASVGLTDKTGSEIPPCPVYFSKNANPAMGDGDLVPLHSHVTQKVDYEAELAVIIGKTAQNISPEEVQGAIFGYTILNDVTARDVQSAHGQWYFGKSLDGHCPMGPYLVTAEEVPFPVELDICCRVNGEIRQSSNTSMLIFDIPRIVSELSRAMTLYPGDIIATGTPGGIGHAMQPPQYLKAGDVVECEIENLGVLRNPFGEKKILVK